MTDRPGGLSGLQNSLPSVGDLQVQGKETDSAYISLKGAAWKNLGLPLRKAGWRLGLEIEQDFGGENCFAISPCRTTVRGTLPLVGSGEMPAMRHELVVLRLCTKGEGGSGKRSPCVRKKTAAT